MSLTVHLALVFHVFIAVAIMVMVCGRHGIGPTGKVTARKPNAQYTPPTPTRRNCFVASRRRCAHEFTTTADGFGDANAQSSHRP